MNGEKANPNASTDKAPVIISSGALFLDGTQLTGAGGGIVLDSGRAYSVARSEMVFNGRPTMQTPDGRYTVPANRIGAISWLEHGESQPTTYGAELEAVHMDGDGRYADLSEERLLKIKELYSFMAEFGTEPTDDPAVLRQRFWDMVHEGVAEAESYGHFLGALSVFGQVEPTRDRLNPSPYVQHVANAMEARTGFKTTELFRTGGWQPHTGFSNTQVGIEVMEAMQYLNPILMAPTLSGPLVAGGRAGDLARATFTPAQHAHMQRMGIRPEDLRGRYRSWRYLLRVLGSPSAGIWQEPAPDTKEAYLRNAHEKLANGEINNIDRANGWHTDRPRLVLDGSGANTGENCAFDTMLGNPNTILPQHLLVSGILTALEQRGLRGQDPREFIARMLGMPQDRTQRLHMAHKMSLRVSRMANDAPTYHNWRPGLWLPMLLKIAGEAPFTHIGEEDAARLRNMFAPHGQAAEAARRWCHDNDADMPTAQTYFDTGVGSPAEYMILQYKALRKQYPRATREELIRRIELDAAQALHRASHRMQPVGNRPRAKVLV